MAPHDLLCKWCSTFVGRDKKFCSIFCESRFTRNRRRKHRPHRQAITSESERLQDFEQNLSAKTEPAAKNDGLLEALWSTTSKSDGQRDKYDLNKDANSKEYTFVKTSEKDEEMIPEAESIHTMASTLSLQALPTQWKHSRTALDLAKRVRSSGYGCPVDPKLRPQSLKPRSAKLPSKAKRESSAKSSKSSNAIVSLPEMDDERALETSRGAKWELISTIVEEARLVTPGNVDGTLIDANPLSPVLDEQMYQSENTADTARSNMVVSGNPFYSSRSSKAFSQNRESTARSRTSNSESFGDTARLRKSISSSIGDTSRTEQSTINEILREESTSSDLLDESVLQERLSSIKRKVEVVKKRGRDSRLSGESDMDTSRLDDSFGYTSDYTSSGMTSSSGRTTGRGSKWSSKSRV